MAKVTMLNMAGAEAGSIELKDEIFGITPNENAVHAVVKNYLANQRQGTQSAKTRGEVRGGGRKPFRQKGTGRHRQGSTTDPSQIGGGIVFAPKPRDYRYTLPKKLRRLAMKSALSAKVADKEIIVLDELKFDAPKTKEMIKVLANVKAGKKALIVMAEKDENVVKSGSQNRAGRHDERLRNREPRQLHRNTGSCKEDRGGVHLMKTAYDIILTPVISEQSMDVAADKKYTFKVAVDANKTQVKHAVEEIFGVEVSKVNIMNYDGKVKRMGRNVGRTAAYKKAIVTLTPNSKEIEFFQGL